MDDIKQSHYYPPSRGGTGSGWVIGAVIAFLVLLIAVLASLGGGSGDGTTVPGDPAAATGTTPEAITEPAVPAAPATDN